MKKLFVVAILMFVVITFFSVSAVQAAGPTEKPLKPENVPVFGIVAGVIEAPYSMVKNMITCKGVFDCINFPKSIGKGLLNGGERIVGTTFLSPFGMYDRDFGKNGVLAKNKIASNVVGWSAVFFAYGAASGVTNTLLGESVSLREAGWATTGGIVGAGFGGIDMLIDKKINDKE